MPQACYLSGAGSVRVSPVVSSANESILTEVLRELGWSCVKAAWCQHYCRLQELKPDYMHHQTFFNAIDYFLVSAQYKSVTILFKWSTKVFHLCVCPAQNDRVAQRGGFHANNGHRIVFVFSDGFVNQWRNKCFDMECVDSLGDKRGTPRGNISPALQTEALAAFSMM